MFKTFAAAALIAVASAGSHNCLSNSRKGYCTKFNCEEGFVSTYCGSGGCYCSIPPFKMTQNYDCGGNDMGSKHGVTIAECKRLCGLDKKCLGFGYDPAQDNLCQRKHAAKSCGSGWSGDWY